MTPYPISLQLGMKRFHGHLFVAPGKLYFVCTAKGGAWAAAIGQGVGGLIGGAIAAVGSAKPGEAPADPDESVVAQAVANNEGSLIMAPDKIQEIKHTMWWRLIRFDGKKYGVPSGIPKNLRPVLAEWARQHNVKVKGLK